MKKLFLCSLSVLFMFSCATMTSQRSNNNEINKFSDRNQTKSEKKGVVSTSEGEKEVVHIDTTAQKSTQDDITDIITGEYLEPPKDNQKKIELNFEDTDSVEPEKKNGSNKPESDIGQGSLPKEPSKEKFIVQAGAFGELTRADEVRFYVEDILKKNNKKNEVFLISHNKHYKVQIGNLPNRHEADGIITILKNNGYNGFVISPSVN